MSAAFESSINARPDRGPAVFAVTTATLVLATVFVVARVICRTAIVKQVGWDDHFVIVAWLIAFALSFVINLGTKRGLGRHDADIPENSWDDLRACEYAFSILYVRPSSRDSTPSPSLALRSADQTRGKGSF